MPEPSSRARSRRVRSASGRRSAAPPVRPSGSASSRSRPSRTSSAHRQVTGSSPALLRRNSTVPPSATTVKRSGAPRRKRWVRASWRGSDDKGMPTPCHTAVVKCCNDPQPHLRRPFSDKFRARRPQNQYWAQLVRRRPAWPTKPSARPRSSTPRPVQPRLLAVLAEPSNHPAIDGTGWVRGPLDGPAAGCGGTGVPDDQVPPQRPGRELRDGQPGPGVRPAARHILGARP